MRTLMTSSLVVAIAVASIACGPQAGSLQAANETLGTAQVNSIEFSGTGRWYQFRTGACGESAVVAVRRQQLHSHDQLRHSRGARGWSNEHELKVSES